MNTGKKFSKMLFLVLLLVAFVAGCGSDDDAAAPLSSAKAITAFVLNGATGVIDETAKTIEVTLPWATSRVGLIATFSTTGASVMVGTTLQTSGVGPANDFTLPVIYTVNAANGTSVDYAVTVTVADSTANSIFQYSIAGQVSSTITGTAIAVTMPYSTPTVTAGIATFAHSGASIKIGLVTQVSGSTSNSFASPKTYTVTAANGDIKTYTVTVTNALNSAKLITAYTITSQVSSTIIASAITVTMPFSTPSVTNLVATFTASPGAVVTVGSTTQVSGTTQNNFTGPVAYKVFPEDGSSFATYTVNVFVEAAPPVLDLRSTATFGALAVSTLTVAATNVTTTVTGDVGATGETIAGILSIVSGTNYPIGSEPTYSTAKADLTLVIADATDTVLFPCGTPISGTLTGVSLTPGVTCISSDAAIDNTGVITLNGPGDYMIRTAGALQPAASSSVVYGVGADATNTSVVWVVGSASLGSPSCNWIGTILSTSGAIVMGDGATLTNGRVLSSAALTLTNNTIAIP